MKTVLSNIERIISRIETASDGLFLKVAGLSPVLYHGTSVENLISILESDTFKLVFTRLDKPTGFLSGEKLYFMSTSRHALGSYHKDLGYASALIVLDGVRLSNKYSGSPMDYWGEWRRKADPTSFESEDRVWSNTPTIPNASSYIKEVRLYLGEDINDSHVSWVVRTTRKALLNAKKKNIPAYVYKNKEAFLTGDKRRSLRIEDWAVPVKTPELYQRPHKRDSSELQVWFELYFKKDRKYLSDEAMKLIYDLRTPHMAAPILLADMNFSRKLPSLPKMVSIWKKEGVKSPEEFIELLRDKWYNT